MKSTKKLIISIAALVIALAVSVSSTFAWFTINSTPEVGDFELNVTAGEGLYIMKADGTYSSTITTADVLALLKGQVAEANVIEAKENSLISAKEAALIATFESTNTGTDEEKATALAIYKQNTLPGELITYKTGDLLTEMATYIADATAAGFATELATYKVGQTFIDLTLADFVMRDVTSADGKAFTAEKGTAIKANDYNNTVGSYISLKLTFRSESELYVGLSEEGTAVTAVGDGADLRKLYAWKDGIDLADYTADTAITGTINKGALIPATRAANAARLSFVNDKATAKVWDPNATKGYTKNDKNMANDYRDALLGSTTTVTAPAASTVTLLGSTIAADDTNSLALLEKGAGEVYYGGSITVNIWLEGWDADCFNSILKDVFATKLIFKGSLKV